MTYSMITKAKKKKKKRELLLYFIVVIVWRHVLLYSCQGHQSSSLFFDQLHCKVIYSCYLSVTSQRRVTFSLVSTIYKHCSIHSIIQTWRNISQTRFLNGRVYFVCAYMSGVMVMKITCSWSYCCCLKFSKMHYTTAQNSRCLYMLFQTELPI